MKKFLILILLLAVFAGLIGYRGYQQKILKQQIVEAEVLKVEIISPSLHRFRDSVSFTAEIEPENKAAVICKVPGRTVLNVYVDEGDRVQQGDLLAELDDSLVRQDILRGKAVVSSAEVQYRTLRSDYERMQALLSEDVISQQRFDHAETEYRSASSQLREAKASLEQLEIMLGYHKITAPVSGVISNRSIDPGDTALSQPPVFLIYQQERVKVTGSVPERSFFLLREEQMARITLDALPGEVFTAPTSRISPTIDPVTRTGEVEVILPSSGILKPGAFARVTIETGEHEGVALPRDVVRPLPGTGEFQFFALSGDRAEQRIVRIGNEENNLVEIPVGLSLEDRVIATISDKLKDGAKVEVYGD
ncbi:MAG: efflux RND transporter periplasmic adaptor subunit [Synergistales bacterium]|nr:efflux RND transporter periplasmic adaptor subunit [Synergistales bacterium]